MDNFCVHNEFSFLAAPSITIHLCFSEQRIKLRGDWKLEKWLLESNSVVICSLFFLKLNSVYYTKFAFLVAPSITNCLRFSEQQIKFRGDCWKLQNWRLRLLQITTITSWNNHNLLQSSKRNWVSFLTEFKSHSSLRKKRHLIQVALVLVERRLFLSTKSHLCLLSDRIQVTFRSAQFAPSITNRIPSWLNDASFCLYGFAFVSTFWQNSSRIRVCTTCAVD